MPDKEMKPLNIIEEANSKTLDYFNKTYVSNLEQVQSLKTELFELEVQIDTLEKTRELYTYHTDSRRNVFSPFLGESDHTVTRGEQIAQQLKDLNDKREHLKKRITGLEQDIHFYKKQVEMLSIAEKCIHAVLLENNEDTVADSSYLEDAIEFIEAEDSEARTRHNYNAMLLEDYANYQHAAILNQNVKQQLISNLNKLETLKWLLHSDVTRAKVTLDELHLSQQSILDSIDTVLEYLNYNVTTKETAQNQIGRLIEQYQKKYPDCTIDFSCDCTEQDLSLPSVISNRLIRMLREIFDNIFQHSNADKVTAKIFISSRLIDVSINDNGIGISEDYLEQSNPYSGLHKLHEVIYQLDGKLEIQGDLISGTNVRFSFPVK